MGSKLVAATGPSDQDREIQDRTEVPLLIAVV